MRSVARQIAEQKGRGARAILATSAMNHPAIVDVAGRAMADARALERGYAAPRALHAALAEPWFVAKSHVRNLCKRPRVESSRW